MLFKISAKNFDKKYVGDFMEATMGLRGNSGLCILGNPYILGGNALMLTEGFTEVLINISMKSHSLDQIVALFLQFPCRVAVHDLIGVRIGMTKFNLP